MWKHFINLLQEQYTIYGYDITREYYIYNNKLGMQRYICNDNNISMYNSNQYIYIYIYIMEYAYT